MTAKLKLSNISLNCPYGTTHSSGSTTIRSTFSCKEFPKCPRMKGSRTFLPLPEFSNTYNIRIEPLKYFGLILALRYLYKCNFSGNESKDPVTSDSFLEAFSKSNKVNRLYMGSLSLLNALHPSKAN